MSPSWESRLEAARKARTDVAGESGPAASRDLPLPENVTWHRVSFVTPVLEGWKIVTGVLAFVTVQNLDELVRAYRFISEHGFTLGGGIGYYLLGLIAFIALWVGLGLLSWWRRAYAVDADGVYLRSGILSRKLRTARLPRIQSVDVVHPLLGRIFGLGQLTVEVAGGRDSRVVIGFLTTRELQTLRDRILDLAAGQIDLAGPAVEGGAVGAGAAGHDTGGIDDAASAVRAEGLTPEGAPGAEGAPGQCAVPMRASHFQEHPLYSVDGATLLGSLLRSSSVYVLGLAVIGMLSVGILLVISDSMTGGEALTIISSYITIVIGAATMVWSQFNSAWNFQAAATPSGIRMSYGLTSETSRTLPPGRVHGVGIAQPILWRGKDWWKVNVTVAGREDRSQDGQNRQFGNLLLPVGVRDTALRALWLVVPDLGVPDPDRLLTQALTGRDDDGVGDQQAPAGSAERGFVRISSRGRLFRPLTWRRAAIALTDTCVIIRHGRWRRRVAVFPYERIQSLRVRQGPLARRRGLASLRLDMVAQEVPASITNLDAADAKALAARISQRALHRARAEQLDRWLARAVAATQPAGPSVR
ncbi:PH domain-containing protein [Actinomyces oris]|uniref:PH domain-containing protein n=1 Tax=Actinomyces oris TaxID=544580 RepID=A0A508BH28_9ACTO|nr:PH domain-containing protein [Actinomyces oris]QQC39041.1 PH domain-containing protein [Actinomyces oris]TQD59008.1 PH domain-containing protein [Actinomyces oris]